MVDVAGMVRSLDPRLKLAAALVAGPCLWKVPLSAAIVVALFLLILVRCLAAGQPGGGKMVRSLLSFVLFWVAVKVVLDAISGVPMEHLALDAGQLAVRLVALLMLGLGLALSTSARALGLAAAWALRPFLGRERSWRIALALSLMVHFLPTCLSTLTGVREVVARRFPEAGFFRRMRMVPQAVIRNLGQKTWNQTLAVACRGLDRPGAWEPDFAWSGRDWIGSVLVIVAIGTVFFL
ncbi:cobalt transporter [uncultured Pseudodesulfovibrio sp.]|uniref:cobalt transporter n=1 Tax=uncultured Pseudodesulfovibrio sp. TaxID=2035858 RepID=UPI0029C6044D|nr:cobalt transporter [uncultured Pseudodesulfovibrio sp.]